MRKNLLNTAIIMVGFGFFCIMNTFILTPIAFADDINIIANPNLSIDSLSKHELKNIYLGKKRNGTTEIELFLSFMSQVMYMKNS